MTLAELLKIVEDSSSEDWHKYPNEHRWAVPHAFQELFIFKNDMDISLSMVAFAEEQNYFEKLNEEAWVKEFPAPHAKPIAIVLRYRGNLIHEWVGVFVDNWNYLLPLPQRIPGKDEYEIPEGNLPFAELFYQLYGSSRGVHRTVREALRRAKVAIVPD